MNFIMIPVRENLPLLPLLATNPAAFFREFLIRHNGGSFTAFNNSTQVNTFLNNNPNRKVLCFKLNNLDVALRSSDDFFRNITRLTYWFNRDSHPLFFTRRFRETPRLYQSHAEFLQQQARLIRNEPGYRPAPFIIRQARVAPALPVRVAPAAPVRVVRAHQPVININAPPRVGFNLFNDNFIPTNQFDYKAIPANAVLPDIKYDDKEGATESLAHGSKDLVCVQTSITADNKPFFQIYDRKMLAQWFETNKTSQYNFKDPNTRTIVDIRDVFSIFYTDFTAHMDKQNKAVSAGANPRPSIKFGHGG